MNKNTSDNTNNLKIAIVAEELTQLGGAERILNVFLEMFPKAPVYTLVWDKEKTKHVYDKFNIKPSFIQKLPFGIKHYKWYLALMPKAVESFDLSEYDVVLSLTSALVKGVKTTKNQVHICYCNTPTRYLWVDSKEYVKNAPIPFFVRPFMPLIINNLKKWDLKASKRPDFYIANSDNVKKRIQKYYNITADKILFPMIDWKKYQKDPRNIKDYFLLVSRIEPYKKVDLVIDAFYDIKDKLKIVGSGTKMAEMAGKASNNIEFVGRVSDDELSKIYAGAKAIIFPQDEDFGLIPVEAMAAGVPTIAYKAGGALETVTEGVTGEYFFPQTAEALRNIIKTFNSEKYKTEVLKKKAFEFDKTLFKKELLEYINSKLKVISNK